MLGTLVFSVLIVIALWPFFIWLGVMNFSKDPNTMEEHLPGRPARRTIGRKNEDVSKSIAYIFLGYLLVTASLYGLLNYKDYVPVTVLVMVGCFGVLIAFFLFSPANRLTHAYADLGHIAVVHLACGLAAGIIVTALIYGYTLVPRDMGALAVTILGAMMVFSRRPDIGLRNKKRKKQQEEFL